MKGSVGAILCAALCAASQLSAQDLSLSLTSRFDDNLGFARASADVVEDISVRTDANLSWHRQLDVRTSVDIRTSLALEHYLRTDDFDTATLQASFSLNRKIGLGSGLSKPLLAIEGNLGWLESQERFRSGLPYGVKLSARSRLSNQAVFSYRASWSGFEPATTYQVPVGVTQRGDAWRWKLLELGATYAVPLSERWGASFDMAAYDGNLVFSTRSTNMLNNIGQARAPDHALGDTFYAYRVEGKAWQSSLVLGFVPAPGQQIQLALGRLFGRSDAGIDYDRTWLELGWTREF